MPEYETISTDIWKATIPSDWSEHESSIEGVFYLESKNHTKGGYFSALCFPDDPRSEREILESIHSAEWRGFSNMTSNHWEVVSEWKIGLPNGGFSGMDVLDRTASHRVVYQIVCDLPWVVRMTLHDYDCTDYEISKRYFQPIIDSLRILKQT